MEARIAIIAMTTHSSLNFVVPDERKAGEMALQELVNAGKKHIGLIHITYHSRGIIGINDEFEVRLKGVKNQAGLFDNPPEITEIMADDWDWQKPGDRIIDRLLKQAPDTDAIICPFDKLSINLMEVLAARNIRVPKQISVISFDNHFYTQFCNPPMTTIVTPVIEYAREIRNGLLAVAQGLAWQKWVTPYVVHRNSI